MEKVEGENNSAENRIWSHIEAIKKYFEKDTFAWLDNFSRNLSAIEDLIDSQEMRLKIVPNVIESASMKIRTLKKDIDELKKNCEGNGDKASLTEEERKILLSRLDNLFV